MKYIRITDNDLTGFDRNGQLRVAFGKGMTQFTAPSIQLGPGDVGRIFAGNNQMNPLGSKVPSTIVSPQPTWTPTVPQVNIAFAIIMAILSAATEMEDSDDDESSWDIRNKKRQMFQVVNFEDYLPEDIS